MIMAMATSFQNKKIYDDDDKNIVVVNDNDPWMGGGRG